MRVLLTGGTGYLGSNLARALTDAGHEVTLLGRSRRGAEDIGLDGLATPDSPPGDPAVPYAATKADSESRRRRRGGDHRRSPRA